MHKIERLKITSETVKMLTENELRDARGGLGSAECSGACTGTYTASCVCPTHTDPSGGGTWYCVASK